MPLRGRRLDSEGLTGSGWHWSTPRRFEAVYGQYVQLSGGVAGWRGVCYAAGMEIPREIVKRCVLVPGGREVPALPVGYRLDHCGMVHDEQRKTTRLRFWAKLGDYPVESYEARACWQALVVYGERVVSLESEVEGGYLMVDVVVAW